MMQHEGNYEGIFNTGLGVKVIVQAFGPFSALASAYLLEQGIGKPGPEGLVVIDENEQIPAKLFAIALERIAKEVGENVVIQVGQHIPKNAKFPPGMDTIEKALASLDPAMHLSHWKNGKRMFDPATGAMQEGIGHFRYRKVEGKNEIHIDCDTLYPCAMDFGLTKAMALRFQPKAHVVHENKDKCRDVTGKTCRYVITW